jgi:hypothetical protein
MARRPESGPGRESAVIRRGSPFGHDETGEGAFVEGKAGENGESPVPFEITAWDETWEKEAERLIKTLRLSLKEARDRVNALVEEKRKMQKEMEAMQDLFLERRQVAEDALMALEQLKNGADVVLPDRSNEGGASWRSDRARLGARIEELEEIERANKAIIDDKDGIVTAQKARILDLEQKLMRSEEKSAARANTIRGLEGSLETMSKSLDDDNATIATLQTELEEERKAIEARVAGAAGEVATKASSLQAQVESLQTDLSEITKQNALKDDDITRLEAQWADMQEYLDSEPSGGGHTIAQVSGLKKEVSELKATLEKSAAELTERAEELERQRSHAAKLDAQIEDKNRINLEYEGMVSDLQSEVSSGTSRIEGLDIQLQSKMNEIATLIERHQTQILRLNDVQTEQEQSHSLQIAQKDSELATHVRVITEHVTTITHCTNQVNELTALTQAQEEEIAKLTQQAETDAAERERERKVNEKKFADWEKKMSLFDILTEYEESAKKMEAELRAVVVSLKEDLADMTAQKDDWHAQYRQALDQRDMQHSDEFYLDLLCTERRLSARLLEEIEAHNVTAAGHRDEMTALNAARDLEMVSYETRVRVQISGTMQQLRAVLAEKTVNETLLRSLLLKLENHAEEARSMYLGEIATRDDTISGLRADLAIERDNVEDCKRDVQDKDVELVRVQAENSDWKLRDLQRKRQLSESIGESLREFEEKVTSGQDITGRAPRLRLQQTEALLRKTQETAKMWEKIAKEYMYEPHLSYDPQNAAASTGGATVSTGAGFGLDVHAIEALTSAQGGQLTLLGSSAATSHAGACLQAVRESVLSSTALGLVQSQDVTNDSLLALRAWIDKELLGEEAEERALEKVLLSWSGLEALCDLRESVRLTVGLQNGEAIEASSLDLQERLFVLFEYGNVTATEFRVMHELKSAFGLTVRSMSEALKLLGLSLSELADRAMQDAMDKHEVSVARAAFFEAQVLCTQLAGVGMDCEKEFNTRLSRLREDLDEAHLLREEYANLRRSYNSSNTQVQLLTDVRDKFDSSMSAPGSVGGDGQSTRGAHSVLSARSARENARDGGSGGDANPHFSHHDHHHQAAADTMSVGGHSALQHHQQSLKEVVNAERERRLVESRGRQQVGDYGALCRADVRSSRLLHQTTQNLSALEIQLSEEDSKDQDKARIVFIKLLRKRLRAESQMNLEKAKMHSRAQHSEAQSERYLQALEEAMAVISTTGRNADADSVTTDPNAPHRGTAATVAADVGNLIKKLVGRHITDMHSRMASNRDRLELECQAMHEMIDFEQEKCVARYRYAQTQQEVLQQAEVQTTDETDHARFRVQEEEVKKVIEQIGADNAMVVVAAGGQEGTSTAGGSKNNDPPPPIDLEPTHADKLAFKSLSHAVKIGLAKLQSVVGDIRRKDSALERLRHVLSAVEGHLIEKSYRKQAKNLQLAFTTLEVADAGVLGGAQLELLQGRITWSAGVVPSLDRAHPKGGVEEGSIGEWTYEDEMSEVSARSFPETDAATTTAAAAATATTAVERPQLSPVPRLEIDESVQQPAPPALPDFAKPGATSSSSTPKKGGGLGGLGSLSPSRLPLPGSAKKIFPMGGNGNNSPGSSPVNNDSIGRGGSRKSGSNKRVQLTEPAGTQQQQQQQQQGNVQRDEAFLEELRLMKQELLSEMNKGAAADAPAKEAAGGGCVMM